MMIGQFFRHAKLLTSAAALLAATAGAAWAVASLDAPNTDGELVMRRLTPEQYRQIVTDVFGKTITLGGRFEPDQRYNGLLALGTGVVSATPTAIEQYEGMARVVADQVVSPERRDTLIPCKPGNAKAADESCATAFLTRAGRLLYRRPLTADETRSWVGVANESATALKDFYAGLSTSLSTMMVSMPFLFRQEIAVPDAAHPGVYHMTDYAKASRISFFLWNTAPDDELLRAAEKGELETQKGMAKQVDRLLASPRLEAGVRAFFTDMLGFSDFDSLAKDRAIYPKFSGKVSRQSEEQTLRTIVDLLVSNGGDYRDLFTTRKTFLTTTLASIYRVPLPRVTPNTTDDAWQPYDFPADSPRVGILSQASFLALHSHPGRSSPTVRGKALREILLCQKVPNPPGDVDFKVVQDTSNPIFKTARKRLGAHANEPMCAGCHKITDPLGLALENFDSAGEFRGAENGEAIDPSGTFDGVKFTNAAELARILHDNPNIPTCVVNRLYTYGTGRPLLKSEGPAVDELKAAFAKDGYKFTQLMRHIALSDALYRVPTPPKLLDRSTAALPAGFGKEAQQ